MSEFKCLGVHKTKEPEWALVTGLVFLLEIIGFIALVTFVGGCQTRITAEKYPETLNKLDGTNYVVTSGGWYVTARSPLWAKEQIKGLDVGAERDGKVWLKTDSYDRDLSTNAVVMTKTIFEGGTNLVANCANAYATIATGGTNNSSIVSKVVSLFKSSGGDENNATVSTSDGVVTVTDGTTCVTCDADGNCTACNR